VKIEFFALFLPYPRFFLFALHHNYTVDRFVLIATTGKNAKPLTLPPFNQPYTHPVFNNS
jgi:hypothetical protein